MKNGYSNQENLSIVGCDGFQNKSIVTCELKYEEDIIYLNLKKERLRRGQSFATVWWLGLLLQKRMIQSTLTEILKVVGTLG